MPYHFVDSNGNTIESDIPGLLGGNCRLKIYGRLDCPSALRARPRGYARHRVFFVDEATAMAAGYRPCGVCMRSRYRRWKYARERRRRRRWTPPLPHPPGGVSIGAAPRSRA